MWWMAASRPAARFDQMIGLRRATGEDASDLAGIFTQARRAMPGVPDIHTAAEDARFIENMLLPTHDVWLGMLDGKVAGLGAHKEGWLTHLYVHPTRHRCGVGLGLLDQMKALNPDGLQLWVFQSNTPARTFYEAHGFSCVELTDGSGNEENHPDARYVWPQPEV